MTSIGSSPTGPKIAAAVLALALLALLSLVFLVVYFAVQPAFLALMLMGVFSLFVALASYFAQALSRDPTIQRAVSWGMGAMGFAMLYLTLWFVPAPSPLAFVVQLEGSLLLTVLLVVTLGLAYWRVRAVTQTRIREARRTDWDAKPAASALDYATAQTPGTSAVGAPSTPPEQRN